MKNNIIQFIMGCLLFTSCSESFITIDEDKSRYVPNTFYNTKAHAIQALNAAYSGLNESAGYGGSIGVMNFCFGDDYSQTGYAAGFGTWGKTIDFNTASTNGEIADCWKGYYANILRCNNALEAMPAAQKAANDPTFTKVVLDNYMGQAYFLRAFMYYNIAQYWGDDKVIIRRTTPKSESEYAIEPQGADSTFNFIEKDLKLAENLLANGLNTTTGYEKGRATRGAAAALLGKFYINRGKYDKAAVEFKKILPKVGDASYGIYLLTANYRDNFIKAKENNSESIFEIQWSNINQTGNSTNELNRIMQNMTLNRTSWPAMWWNFAIPYFKLNSFENWTETIDGATATVYDYRAYATFWGVPNGAKFTYVGVAKDWIAQGWANETVDGVKGVLGSRKYALDSDAEAPAGAGATWSEINYRIIRLADIELLYAECMANLNPSNVTPTDVNSAIYWIDQVRNRANNVATDQSHLYSARAGAVGKLPTATALKAVKGWSLMELIQHERFVEGYAEGWRREDMLRWKVAASFVTNKSAFTGYQSLILPVPQIELDNNPKMPR